MYTIYMYMAFGVFAATSGAPAAPYTARSIPCIYQAQSVGHCSGATTAHRVYTDHHLEWCRAYMLSPLQTYVFRRARVEYAFVPPPTPVQHTTAAAPPRAPPCILSCACVCLRRVYVPT